jgi:hypothetical protein
MSKSPLNYSDVDYDLVGQQVHADGEIWSGDELRRPPGDDRAVRRGHAGAAEACADGKVPVTACPGNRRWAQLVFDAFLLMANSAVSMSTCGTRCSRPTWSASAARTRRCCGTRSPSAAWARTRPAPARRRRPGAELRVAVRQQRDAAVRRRGEGRRHGCTSATTRPGRCRWPTPTRRRRCPTRSRSCPGATRSCRGGRVRAQEVQPRCSCPAGSCGPAAVNLPATWPRPRPGATATGDGVNLGQAHRRHRGDRLGVARCRWPASGSPSTWPGDRP